ARGEEALYLEAPVVEKDTAPLRVFALARIAVLVEVRAVEVDDAMAVSRKMRRHPVEDHADAVRVQGVDKSHDVLLRAVARGRHGDGAALGALAHPALILPGVVEVPDDAGGVRRALLRDAIGVRLVGERLPRSGHDAVLVELPASDNGREARPDPTRREARQWH